MQKYADMQNCNAKILVLYSVDIETISVSVLYKKSSILDVFTSCEIIHF